MFRPKLELHVHFYELAYLNVTIAYLKGEFDLFLLFLRWASIFSQFITEHFHILVYLSIQHLFLLNRNSHLRIITLASLDIFYFAPTYELQQGVLKVNSFISGILLDPFWRKLPKYIRRAKMYPGSAKSFEEGSTELYFMPAPFCYPGFMIPLKSLYLLLT